MRKINLLLPALMLLAISQLFAQGKAIISGKISNPLSGQIELAVYPNPLIPEEVKTEVRLIDKSFRIEVPVEEAMVAELLHGDEVVQVYLEPGYDLYLSANGKSFLKSLKYEGKGANENNYLATYTYRFDEEEDYQVLPDNIKLKEKEFTEFLDYRRNDQLSSLQKYSSKMPVSGGFREFMLAEIAFSYAVDKLSFHPLRQQVMQMVFTKPSPEFYNYLYELDLDRPAHLLSPSFVNFLRNYTTYFAKEAGYGETHPQFFKARYDVAEQKLQGQVRLVAQAQVLKQSILQGHLKYTEQMLKDFSSKNEDQAGNTYLANLLNDNTTLVTGGLAPDFTLKNIAGDSVSLSDFKGKLVYLNFWRSNCGLCNVELPYLQQLTGKLGSHRIVFLNVAIGDDETQWRQLVQLKKLQGEHVLAKQGAADLVKRYGLKDVPAYFLIDAEGRFISLKARRPSDHEATNDILQHLEVRQAYLE